MYSMFCLLLTGSRPDVFFSFSSFLHRPELCDIIVALSDFQGWYRISDVDLKSTSKRRTNTDVVAFSDFCIDFCVR